MTVRSAPPVHHPLEDHTVYRFASQLSRLRPTVLLVAAGIVGACADDQSITSPHPDAATPSLAGANATPEATDPNVLAITVTPGKTGTIGTRTGIILLNVTTTCSKAGALIRLGATLTQYDRRTGAGVTGSGEIDFGCTTVSFPLGRSTTFLTGRVIVHPADP